MSLPTPYYERNGITIYCGDCRTILPELPQVDLVLTDPPYNFKHVDGGGFASATAFYRDGALYGMTDFHLEEYAEILFNCANSLVVFHSRDSIVEFAAKAQQHQWRYDLHFWHKTNAIPFCHNTWKSDVEYISVMWNGTKSFLNGLPQSDYSKVYTSPINTESQHPAQKPLALMAKYIKILQVATVLDPFMGSGTTLVAAKKLGRKCIGIEIEEKYCAIAVKRLAQEVMNFEEAK